MDCTFWGDDTHQNVGALMSKLRILQLTEATSAGVGRHVSDLCEGLLERGHSVSLAYSGLGTSPVFLNAVTTLRSRHINFQSLSVPIQRWPSPSDWACAKKIRRQFPAAFDVVHAHSTKAGFLSRVWLQGAGRALVYSPHAPLSMNVSQGKCFQRTAAVLEALLAHRCDRIICVSSMERRHMLSIGIDSRKLEVVVNGLPPAPAPVPGIRERFGVTTNTLALVTVGRLARQKGIDILLDALGKIEASVRERLMLFVVGDGPERERLQAQSRAHGLESIVRWLGEQPAEQILAAFDLLVLPSRYEGMPYVLLEAQRAGLPIVASDVGGVEELLGTSQCGVVVPAENPAALASALVRLFEDASLRKKCGENARVRSSHFTAQRMTELTETAYFRSLNLL